MLALGAVTLFEGNLVFSLEESLETVVGFFRFNLSPPGVPKSCSLQYVHDCC